MAEDYGPILSTETDPNAPLRSSLFKRMVANPIAIAEGAEGAPRIKIGALERLAAGNQVRWQRLDTQTKSPGMTWGTAMSFGSLQAGSIRLKFETQYAASRVVVKRVGVTTVVATFSATGGTTAWQARTADASILPGDEISVEYGNINSDSSIRNITISTDGQDLIPGVYSPIVGYTLNV